MSDIFVFGSNLSGRHGKGAALYATRKCGARLGVGVGPTGRAYAIPTKDGKLRTLPLGTIEGHIRTFVRHAKKNPKTQFYVTAAGTGLAGYSHAEIAPFFSKVTANCSLPAEWADIIPKEGRVFREAGHDHSQENKKRQGKTRVAPEGQATLFA